MKRNILLAAALLAAGTLLADSKDDVTAAAKALGDKDNYSWKSTLDMGANAQFRPGPTEGKTDKSGVVWISRTFNDNTIETVIKGKKGAIKTEDGWQSSEEAAQGQGFGRFFAGMIATFKAPVAEAQDLADKTKSLKSDEGVITGELTEEGAKARLTFGRGRRGGNGGPPPISNAKGTVKFWVKDGVLSKYESHVTGTRKNQDGDDVDVDMTTTVEIKDVGNTKVSIPEEAAKKLE